MSEHTKTPWKLYKAKLRPDISDVVIIEVQDRNGKSIIKWGGFDGQKNRDANAAFIVRACNSHDDLLAALRLCLPVMEVDAEMSHFLQGFARQENENDRVLARVKAAIEEVER